MLAKDAFNSVCEQVAAKYVEDGWRYAKSKHWMTKKDKNFKYQVRFYTSWNNISDVSVEFYGAWLIYPLKQKGPVKESYYGLGTQRCHLPKEGHLYWEIAKPEYWEKAVTEFTDWLDKTFLPIVDNCMNHLEDYVQQVAREGFYPPNGYCDSTSIPFILDHGSLELAREAAQKYYDGLKENTKAHFKKCYENVQEALEGNGEISEDTERMLHWNTDFRAIAENKIPIQF